MKHLHHVLFVALAAMLSAAFTGQASFAAPAPPTVEGPPESGDTKPIQQHQDRIPNPLDQPAPSSTRTASEWTLEDSTGTASIEDYGSWVHFASGDKNGNSPTGTLPAIAVSKTAIDLRQPHAVRATLFSGNTQNRFGFYLGYKDPGNGLFIGFDSGGWFWQKYAGGDGDYFKGKRIPAPSSGNHTAEIEWTGTVATLYVDDVKAFDVNYGDMTGLTDQLAMKAGTFNGVTTSEYIANFGDYAPDANEYSVSGIVKDSAGNPISGVGLRASAGRDDKGAKTTTEADGTFTLTGLKTGKHTLLVFKQGYDDLTQDVNIDHTNLTLQDIVLTKSAEISTKTLRNDDMEAEINEHFPSVVRYTMKKQGGKVMYGQTKDVRNVEINGTNVALKGSDATFTDLGQNKARYNLNVKDPSKNIDATLVVDMSLKANSLDIKVATVCNNAGDSHPVQTIAFPGQSLVSVRSNQSDPQFTGTRMSSDTSKNGDTTFKIDQNTRINDAGDYIYGFVSGGGLSAGLWSNSEHDGTTVEAVAGGAKNTRVVASTQSLEGETSLGLTSAPWYYDRVVTDSKNTSYADGPTTMPEEKIVITGDENSDDTVNWEDGAIAYRSIMNNPYKSEEVPDLVSYRIAMNFGGQAQNPFLTTLDNVKKVALNTDELGQSVLLKGYANEGHDSGHPDYGDIGHRIGGAKDMNTLMTRGKQYGARFGVHVNASEMYPEAKAFSEGMARRNSSGGLQYGWNWLDQAVGIDGIYDLNHGRAQRFGDLKKKVGDNLDFIYVDVWGNNTSGKEDSWETRKLSKEINDNGWRMADEWGSGNEYDATFQHWAADLTYGGTKLKGENSQVMRFLRNHQKDSWVGDYPSYGDAAKAPLLGGYDMKDFEGWQGRNDYAAYITNLYTHDLSTKFLQHFTVNQWVNNPLDPTAPKDASVNNGNEQITLVDSHGNTVVVSRASNTISSADYRNRTIKLNGNTVASGAVTSGDDKIAGNESYLLPWLWNAQTGKMMNADKQKLYHWNTIGGKTTWTLPQGWKNLSNVKVYRLSDQGKSDEQTVPVSDGNITLNAKAKTPYVVYQGAQQPLKVQWSEGMHVVDAGFNGGPKTLGTNWKVDGNGKAEIVGINNAMLKLTGESSVSQEMTGLTAGKRYAVYLGVDNRSAGQASITVSNGEKTLARNTTGRSIAQNYVKAYAHNKNSGVQDNTGYFQNMYVWFTAPTSGKAALTLSHEPVAGDTGHAYFDDVRILENGYDGITYEKNGTLKTLTNDFEDNAQGIWPFVVGGLEGVEDNRTHLSELHKPYTQANWDVKKMDDVLGGHWSVKTNGLVQDSDLVYQTIPQNVRLEPGQTYRVSFDYQSGSDGIYAFATGDGRYDSNSVSLTPLSKALGTTAHATYTVTGGLDGDTWFGIYSTDKAPDLQGTSGDAANFGGYQDFVLDNLKVEHVTSQSRTKAQVEAKLRTIRDKYDSKSSQYSDEAWDTYQSTLDKARVLTDKDGASAADFTEAYDLLVALDDYMQHAPNGFDKSDWDVAGDQYTVSVGSERTGSDSEGPKELAQDGKPDTWWHTAYSHNAITSGDGWYEFDLSKPTTVNGLRYLPRQGGATVNGKIKKFNIDVTDKSGNVTHAVVDGEFSTDTAWQKVSFKSVTNAVKVRLTAVETAGQSADETNCYVSAAELRLTTERDVTRNPVADKTGLKRSIARAQKIVDEANASTGSGMPRGAISPLRADGQYTKESWQALLATLDKAKKVEFEASATNYEVGLAKANLDTAIDGLVRTTPSPAPNPAPTPSPAPNPAPLPNPQPALRPAPNPTVNGKNQDNRTVSQKLANTGSFATTMVLAALALLAAGICLSKASHRRLRQR